MAHGLYRPKPKTRKDGRPGATAWAYDFVLDGARVRGSTGQYDRRAAELVVEKVRAEIARGIRDRFGRPRPERLPWTLSQAAGQYWADVGRDSKSAVEIDRMTKSALALIGRDTRIADMDMAVVSAALAARQRGEGPRARANPSAATLNRWLENLAAILNHAARRHRQAVGEIDWSSLHRKEARRVARGFTGSQVEAWGSELDDPVERFFLHLLLRYGPRFGELFVAPDALDLSDPAKPRLILGRYKGRRGWVETRKDGNEHALALLPEDAEIIQGLGERARRQGHETIWSTTYRGRPHEILYFGMRNRLREAAKRAGVTIPRLLHSARHDAGTAITATGGVRLAQRALGHASVTTTERYAHVIDDPLRAAIEAASRRIPRLALPTPNEVFTAQGLDMVPPPGIEPGEDK